MLTTLLSPDHGEARALLWSAGLIAVFAPLAVWLYRGTVH